MAEQVTAALARQGRLVAAAQTARRQAMPMVEMSWMRRQVRRRQVSMSEEKGHEMRDPLAASIKGAPTRTAVAAARGQLRPQQRRRNGSREEE